MAVVNVKSQPITDQDASPRVSVQSGAGAPYREKSVDAFASIANGDSIASTYRMVRVPSNCRMKELTLEVPVAIATAIADIGVYKASSQNDVGAGQVVGEVIDVDFFATVQTLVAAGRFEVINESGTYLVSLRDNLLWEALGLTSDPGGKFDIVLTLTAAATAAGLVYMKAQYAE